jgi:hypothetical protein
MVHTLNYKRPPQYGRYKDRHTTEGYSSKMISEKLFKKISSKDCHYCGVAGPNGTDRLNCAKGYEKSNCVPCCKHCNYVKGNLSLTDFIEWTTRFVKHQLKTNNYGGQYQT